MENFHEEFKTVILFSMVFLATALISYFMEEFLVALLSAIACLVTIGYCMVIAIQHYKNQNPNLNGNNEDDKKEV